MRWICEVVCIVLLFGGMGIYYENKENNNSLRTIGLNSLIIGIIMFIILMFTME